MVGKNSHDMQYQMTEKKLKQKPTNFFLCKHVYMTQLNREAKMSNGISRLISIHERHTAVWCLRLP